MSSLVGWVLRSRRSVLSYVAFWVRLAAKKLSCWQVSLGGRFVVSYRWDLISPSTFRDPEFTGWRGCWLRSYCTSPLPSLQLISIKAFQGLAQLLNAQIRGICDFPSPLFKINSTRVKSVRTHKSVMWRKQKYLSGRESRSEFWPGLSVCSLLPRLLLSAGC